MKNFLIILFLIFPASFFSGIYGQSSIRISGPGSYISVESTPQISLQEFTVECWFMREDTGSSITTGVYGVDAVPLISKGTEEDENSAYMNYFLGIRKQDSVLVADFEESVINYHKGKNHPLVGFTSLERNIWYHAVVTYDGIFLRLYLDGSLESAIRVGRLPMDQSANDVAIGSVLLSGGTSEGYFHGMIDEVRIWNYARSENEIRKAINSEMLAVQPGLVMRLGLNEGSGDVISYSGEAALNTGINGSNWGWSYGAFFENINPPGCNDSPCLKIGLIADPQYCDRDPLVTRFYRETMWKLPEAVDTLNKYNVDFVMTLGDVIDKYYESFDSVLPLYNDLSMPDYKLLGNHAFEEVADSLKDTIIHLYNMPDYYYDFSYDKWRFIVLDGTELAEYDSILHMDLRDEADSVWQSVQGEINDFTWNGGIGRTQRNWIESRITDAENNDEKVILFCHFPLYPEHELNLWNRFDIIDIVEKYDNVIAYINGHNHDGNYGFLNGKHYITHKAMVETADTNSFSILNIYNKKLDFKSYGLMNDQILTFKNIDKKPYDITLSNNIITYDLDSGSYIGSLSTADSSSSAAYSYGLINNTSYVNNLMYNISGDSLFLSTDDDISGIENIRIKTASKNCNLDTVSKVFTIEFDTVAVELYMMISDTTLSLGEPDMVLSLDSVFTDKSESGLFYGVVSGDETRVAVSIDGKNLVAEPLAGGKSTISVSALDSYTGQSIADTFIITVFDPLNHYPVVQNPPGDMIVQLEYDSLVIDLDTIFYDDDIDTLIYDVTCINDTTVYYSVDNSLLSIHPLKAGEDSVIVFADDDRGGAAILSFKVTVNTSPVAKYAFSVFLAQIYHDFPDISLDTIFSDPDGNTLVYSIDSADAGIVSSEITGSELTIDLINAGFVIVYVSADDGFGGRAAWELHLTINSPPQVAVNIPDQLFTLGESDVVYIDLDTVFTDPDGDSLVYLINNSNPEILTINENGAVLELVPVSEGITQVDIRAEDQRGSLATDTFSVTVDEPSGIIMYKTQKGSFLTGYPNPFKHNAILHFELKESSYVVISVYNQYGMHARTLVSGILTPGIKEIEFDSDDFPTGIYFCKILIDNKLVETNKMIIVK